MRITKDYGLTASKLEHDLLARLNKVYKPVKKTQEESASGKAWKKVQSCVAWPKFRRTKMKIEIDKEDFVKLAVYASWAYLPDEEDKCEMTLEKIMDSLDKEDAAKITIDILALRTKIALLSGVNVEEVVKTLMETMKEIDE
nr:MAG TPA: hypothetical protein [Caudoviricetes sp.]